MGRTSELHLSVNFNMTSIIVARGQIEAETYDRPVTGGPAARASGPGPFVNFLVYPIITSGKTKKKPPTREAQEGRIRQYRATVTRNIHRVAIYSYERVYNALPDCRPPGGRSRQDTERNDAERPLPESTVNKTAGD